MNHHTIGDSVRLSAANYSELHAGLDDMIKGGRVTELEIPDDYHWLTMSLAELTKRSKLGHLSHQPTLLSTQQQQDLSQPLVPSVVDQKSYSRDVDRENSDQAGWQLPSRSHVAKDLRIRDSDYAALKVLLRRAARKSTTQSMQEWLDRYRHNGWDDAKFGKDWFHLASPERRSRWVNAVTNAGFTQQDIDQALERAGRDLVDNG